MRCCVERHSACFSAATKCALKSQLQGLEVEIAAQLEGAFSESVSPTASPRVAFAMAGSSGPPAPFLGSAADRGSTEDGAVTGSGIFKGSVALPGLKGPSSAGGPAGTAAEQLAGKLAEVARLRAGVDDDTNSYPQGFPLTQGPSTSSPHIPVGHGHRAGDSSGRVDTHGAGTAARAEKKAGAGPIEGGAHARSSSLPEALAGTTSSLSGSLLGHALSVSTAPRHNSVENISSLDPLQVCVGG